MRREAWLVWACAAGLVVLVFAARVSYRASDPELSLVVSQAIWQEGTVKLDVYKDRTTPPLDTLGTTGMVLRHQGHYYYYLPLGPSVFSLPFVALANVVGLDMTTPRHNHAVQKAIVALIVPAIFLALVAIGRCYLDERPTTKDQRPNILPPSPCHPVTLSPCHLVTLSSPWSQCWAAG